MPPSEFPDCLADVTGAWETGPDEARFAAALIRRKAPLRRIVENVKNLRFCAATFEAQAMPIWRLQPCDPDDPNWEASSHRGPVTVRAPNEAAAREIAQQAFGVKTGFGPGKGMLAPPWLRPDLVRIEIVESATFPAEGPDEVLEPTFGQDLPQHQRRRTKTPAGHGKIAPRKTT